MFGKTLKEIVVFLLEWAVQAYCVFPTTGKCSEQIVSRHTPATAAASIFQACEQAISAL